MQTNTITETAFSTSQLNYSLGNGGFLVTPCPPGVIFTREQVDEEQQEVAKIAFDFCSSKVEPLYEQLEKQARDENGIPLAVKLVKEAGELGLLSIDIPEQYNGLEMGITTNMYAVEHLSMFGGGFLLTILSHIGIGTMPILLFGNEQQKEKYVTKLATGEMLGCYCLTEPGSGSDALSGRTEAKLEGDHYILNGSKQFITNGGWANLAVVFTNVNGRYSALIVELDQPGVVRGMEEKKMGIKGSSTTSLTFENVKVPKENLLGKVGDASNIALNILNIGRLELGFGTLGGAKATINRAFEYANQRKQFGRPIAEFDMQKARLANMTRWIFELDSISYRMIAPINKKIDDSENIISALRSYAMEASICKVVGSETLYNVAENAVKLLGGYGYIQEYRVEAIFRDSVINLIYEGTNDINRLVIFDFLVRNIYGGGIPYRAFMEKVDKALTSRELTYPYEDNIFTQEKYRLYAAKHLVGYLIQRAILRWGKDISNNQQIIQNISDALIALYIVDSVLARVHYLVDNHGEKGTKIERAMASLVTAERLSQVRNLARELLPEVARAYEVDKVRDNVNWLIQLTEGKENVFELKRVVAKRVMDKGKYCF